MYYIVKIILYVLFFIANYIALYLYINVVFPLIKYLKKIFLTNLLIQGVYELVAKNQEGEEQSQIVELTEEQVKLSLQAQDDQAEKKAKKKKKKKTVKKKEVIKPEISSFLKNQILKEGENIGEKND